MSNRLERTLGVTRIARVTGLDRLGVEVACAIRPLGYVLQVTNGKGNSFAAARRAAIGEAAELWAAERVDPGELVYSTARALRRLHGAAAVWDGDLGSAGQLLVPKRWSEDAVIVFREGRDLVSGERIFVPAAAVHCPPPGAPDMGLLKWAWSSNGMAAGRTVGAATLHALLEAIERDQLARALPEGWTAEAIAARGLRADTLSASVQHWVARFAAVGVETLFLDLRLAKGLGLPVAAALLIDQEPAAPVPVTAGYACRLQSEEALLAALFEAAQSRLTDIHGARDDVEPMDPDDVQRLRAYVRRAKLRRALSALPVVPKVAALDLLDLILTRLVKAGHRRVGLVELGRPGPGWVVVKVVVPSFLLSGLL